MKKRALYFKVSETDGAMLDQIVERDFKTMTEFVETMIREYHAGYRMKKTTRPFPKVTVNDFHSLD